MVKPVPNFGYDPSREGSFPRAPKSRSPPPLEAIVDVGMLPPVGQQGTAAEPGSPGTCCAWASTYGLATFFAAQRRRVDPATSVGRASPAQIYIQVMQKLHGSQQQCGDSAFADYFNLLVDPGGTPSMAGAPYVASCSGLWSRYENAPVARDSSFSINKPLSVPAADLAAVKSTISDGYAQGWGTGLYTDWAEYEGPDLPVPYVGSGARSGAYHCMLLIGYNDAIGDGAFLVQNSQGAAWGTTIDGTSGTGNCYGYVWMAYETFSALAEPNAFYIPRNSS